MIWIAFNGYWLSKPVTVQGDAIGISEGEARERVMQSILH